jgi:hypothetical protein
MLPGFSWVLALAAFVLGGGPVQRILMEPAMSDTPDTPTDTPPDRLSTDPRSPYYNPQVLERDVGIRFKGVERTNVEEYCVSEGWVRVSAGPAKDRYGNPMTIKLTGTVEPYFRPRQ